MIELVKQLISIHKMKADQRKAIKILSKQEWSIEFFAMLVQKAATRKITFTITNGGQKVTIAASQLPVLRDPGEAVDVRSSEVTLQELLDDASRAGLLA